MNSHFTASQLPVGAAHAPVALPHFPDRLHAFVWRNWQLVPPERMAQVLGATPEAVVDLGRAMGLAGPPEVTADQARRSALTVIRRNWHLLPYEQLLALLGWTAEELDYALREDDFLFIKLGSLKPRCEPLRWRPLGAAARARTAEIAAIVRREFGDDVGEFEESLFRFVTDLAAPPEDPAPPRASRFSPRFCSSYFALYGDPLLEPGPGPYPDGYLARLAAAGVDGIWLQAVLRRLAPLYDDRSHDGRHAERIENLRALVARAQKHGIGVYLYLNEPRAMPLDYFELHPELKGVTVGDFAALCPSSPGVQHYLIVAIGDLCRAVPGLSGFFTITASENLTHCWSHGGGAACLRCGQRSPAELVVHVNELVADGIRLSGSEAQLIAWDWGWADAWAADAIEQLPQSAALMSVSEWDLPIQRGGIETKVGEYSLSAIGPGPRSRRHWSLARARGLTTIAKLQIGCTWELSAVPYVPAVENVARLVANLREEGVDGLMLGWTLGSYPSPNLEVAAELGAAPETTPDEAMAAVAQRRFGAAVAPLVVEAWRRFSAAFREFPFHIEVVYKAPLQLGPANLLWEAPTGYRATMVGFAYDDLDAWRAVYPVEVFIGQLTRVADGFESALERLRRALPAGDPPPALAAEMRVAEAAAIHFRSVAAQSRFVQARDALDGARTAAERHELHDLLQATLEEEIGLARRLYTLQRSDSRIGFEASNQYYYVPVDLVEKVLNCRDLLDRWLPSLRGGTGPGGSGRTGKPAR